MRAEVAAFLFKFFSSKTRLCAIDRRAINGSVQYTTSGSLPYILLLIFTQAITRVWFDVTIIDINTILLQCLKKNQNAPRPYSVYVGV